MRARFEGEGDVIVVTGGAGGIGRALACAAAQAGARVVVCDVDEPAMATLSEVSGISTRRLDVADRADVFAGLGEVERRFGKIDGLVCAAAIQPRLCHVITTRSTMIFMTVDFGDMASLV